MNQAALAPDTFNADCPTRRILDRIADKWTVLILDLLLESPLRFNELLRRIGGLSQKMLSQTLKTLERDGLVLRTAFPTVPVTVEYRITELGVTLAETLKPLRLWAEANMEAIDQAQLRYDSTPR
ncbi:MULTISPECIES: helix-turn-helix domain-containing protein [unclassified Pseudomonas]|uniref:winged helix-turn-helix transcriptional regulator n=1 Tax=unclassified Pseudomonas TaxID=196821 RepID=UPI00257B6166|nr:MULTISPECIES: helix-turn-helix domain-containing protein [unclassified Pseudomonas]